ncbi:hypothetical protein [Cellulomonas sp. HZM]|uniref:hypothetical protein n=1 Tax=Cellulomonas sp. HZM TaxID=1454010 RepID=UPI00049357B3|nr:hypothetical protein [Cellulomonas sp. HZM]
MLWAQLGPIGYLQDLPDVAPVQVASDRATSELVTLGGLRYVQTAPRAPRTWSVPMTFLSPAQVAFLHACAQGAVPGDLYLLTSDAAAANLLPPHLAAPGAGKDTTLGPVSTSPTSGVPVPGTGPMIGVATAASAGPWSPTVPLRSSAAHFLSCWVLSGTSMPAGSVIAQYQVVTGGGAVLATGNIVAATTGTLVRATASFTTGATAGGVQLATAATAGRTITALRLTEGTPSGTEWAAGAGAAKVVVDDPAQTLNLVRGSTVLSDYQWTLREVA